MREVVVPMEAEVERQRERAATGKVYTYAMDPPQRWVAQVDF